MAQTVYDPDSDERRAPGQTPMREGLDDFRKQMGLSDQDENSMDNNALDGAVNDIKAREGASNGDDNRGINTEKSLDPDNLNAHENKATAGAADFAFNAEDQGSRMQQLRDFAAKNKKKGIAGGGIAGLIIALFGFGIAAIVPYELVTLEKDLVRYEAKEEQHFEDKAAQKILGHIICRALPTGVIATATAGCKGSDKADTDPEDNQTTSEQANEDKLAATDGEALTTNMDTFKLSDPTIMNSLSDQGIKVNLDTNGNVASVLDVNTGSEVTPSDLAENTDLISRFQAALPEWNVGQIETLRPLELANSDASWSGIPDDTEPKDVDSAIEAKVAEGASSQDITTAADEAAQEADGTVTNGSIPKGDVNPADSPSALAASESVDGSLGGAVQAAESASKNGATGSAAVDAGVKEFEAGEGDPLFATSIATTGCSIEQDVNKASTTRKPTIMKLLVHHFTLFASLAGQIQDGKLKGATINKAMEIVDGDPSALSGTEESKPATDSAAYQREAGNSITTDPKSASYNPDISNSAKPTNIAGTNVVAEVHTVLGATGGNFACSVLTSPIGGIVQGFLGAVQFVSDIGSFGVTQAAITASIIAAQEFLNHVVLPDIIKYFTPFGINGTEDAVQFYNNTDAGANLTYNDYSRRLGGEPMTTTDANKQYAIAANAQIAEEHQQSWANRTFALSNPESLISRLAVEIPTEKSTMFADMTNYFSNIPKLLSHGLATILTPRRALAADGGTNPGVPYDITQYGYNDSDLEKYDPIANEQFLFQKSITYAGVSETRIQLMGNPNLYQNNSVDTSTTDIFHCFDDGYNLDPNNPTADMTSPDPICGSLGSYDMSSVVPTDIGPEQVANSYCVQLTNSGSVSDMQSTHPNCIADVEAQESDDIGHFRQYILDVHVMGDYESLTTNQ